MYVRWDLTRCSNSYWSDKQDILMSRGTWQASLSGETEDIDDHVVVFEGILLTKITIIFAVPEATGTHVESTVALLQDNHVCCELKIFIDLLQKLDNYLTGVVAPLLSFLRIVVA